jgi:UDP-glucuronate 4-epimerase
MSYSYSEIYKIRTVGLRFFTVYGPYGRPDMTPYTFLNSYYAKKFIKIFGFGDHERDFTYIDDTVNMIISLFKKLKSNNSKKKFEIYNVAKGSTSKLKTYISLIEKNLKIKFRKKYIKYQSGDVRKTYGDTTKINRLIKYSSQFDIKQGLSKFTSWYKEYHKRK